MGKVRVARKREPIDYHNVTIALSRARAAHVLLKVLNDGDDYLQIPFRMTAEEDAETRAWLVDIAEEALDEAEAAFRKSLTPEQAHEQVIGGPKAVA